MAARSKRMVADRSFKGHEGEGFLPRGRAFDTTPSAATAYAGKGLAHEMPGPPSKGDAASAAADNDRQLAEKAAKDAEKKSVRGTSKEDPGKDASGLDPWPLASISEEQYVEKYGPEKDASDAVKERLTLARARIRGKVSAGASG